MLRGRRRRRLPDGHRHRLAGRDCSDYAEALAADNGGDCDDVDGSVYPGADEYCDGADNDCDGQIDEDGLDTQSWYTDADGDGYGDPASAILSCQQPAGATVDGTDCDDGDASVNPGAAEACDGLDNNCDGAADTGAALEVGYLPAWAASYTDSSLAWSALETDSLRYGSCPLNITDTGSGFTLATLLAYDVLIISDPAGGGRQYSAGELTAISDYLTGGYGGAISTYLLKYTSVDNSSLQSLFGVSGAAFSDMPGSVTTGATVVLPAHPVVANVPASFTLVSFTAEQGVTGGWSSVVPDATAGFLIQGAGGSSVIANDTGAWRTVLFTGMVDYQTPGDDARQILYDALMWSGGY